MQPYNLVSMLFYLKSCSADKTTTSTIPIPFIKNINHNLQPMNSAKKHTVLCDVQMNPDMISFFFSSGVWHISLLYIVSNKILYTRRTCSKRYTIFLHLWSQTFVSYLINCEQIGPVVLDLTFLWRPSILLFNFKK